MTSPQRSSEPTVELAIADRLFEAEDYSAAIRSYASIEREHLARGDADNALLARVRRAIGAAHHNLENYDAAAVALAEASALYALADDVEGQAECEVRLAWTARTLTRLDESLRHGHLALDLFSADSTPANVARARFELANTLTRLRRDTEAIAQFADAAHDFEFVEDAVGAARCHWATGDIHSRSDRWSDALAAYRTASQLATGLDNRWTAARIAQSTGLALYHLGELEEALGRLRSALDMFIEASDLKEMAVCTGRIATVLGRLGRADDELTVRMANRSLLALLNDVDSLQRLDEYLVVHEDELRHRRDEATAIVRQASDDRRFSWLRNADIDDAAWVVATVREARANSAGEGRQITDREIYLRYRRLIEPTGSFDLMSGFKIIDALMGGDRGGTLPF